MGCGLGGCGAGAAGLRVDRGGRAPAGFVRRGIQDDQRAGGAGCHRPVGDDARSPGGGNLRCPDRAGAEASRLRRAARHLDRGTVSPACWFAASPEACQGRRLAGPRDLGDIRLHSADGVAGRRASSGSTSTPYGLRPAVSAGAARGFAHLLGWFVAELHRGARTGWPGRAHPGREPQGLLASGRRSCPRESPLSGHEAGPPGPGAMDGGARSFLGVSSPDLRHSSPPVVDNVGIARAVTGPRWDGASSRPGSPDGSPGRPAPVHARSRPAFAPATRTDAPRSAASP